MNRHSAFQSTIDSKETSGLYYFSMDIIMFLHTIVPFHEGFALLETTGDSALCSGGGRAVNQE